MIISRSTSLGYINFHTHFIAYKSKTQLHIYKLKLRCRFMGTTRPFSYVSTNDEQFSDSANISDLFQKSVSDCFQKLQGFSYPLSTGLNFQSMRMHGILKQVAPEFEFSILNNVSPIALDYSSEYAESLQPGSKMANNLAISCSQTVSVADSGSIACVRAHSQEVRGLVLSKW